MRLAIMLWLFIGLPWVSTHAALTPESSSYLLPMSCAELLQDASPFLSYFEAVAQGMVTQDRKLSRRLFRILSLRERLGEATGRTRESNPIDTLIRKTLCFYREQKEPLRQIPFDDPEFLKFLKSGLKELEEKVDDTVYQWELERQQQREYEKRLRQNRGEVETVQREARNEALRSFDRLSEAARKKVRTP